MSYKTDFNEVQQRPARFSMDSRARPNDINNKQRTARMSNDLDYRSSKAVSTSHEFPSNMLKTFPSKLDEESEFALPTIDIQVLNTIPVGDSEIEEPSSPSISKFHLPSIKGSMKKLIDTSNFRSSALATFVRKKKHNSEHIGSVQGRSKSYHKDRQPLNLQYPYNPIALSRSHSGGRTKPDKASERAVSTEPVTPTAKPTALDRRRAYDKTHAKGHPGVGETHIPITKGRVFPLQDIMRMKDYFDELDRDQDGVVTMEEMCKNRKDRLISSDSNTFEDILLTICDDFTFVTLIEQAFPQLSKVDAKLCCEAAERKAQGKKIIKEKDEKKSSEKTEGNGRVDVSHELKEAFETWPFYAPEGSLNFRAFRAFLKAHGDDSSKDEDYKIFSQLADDISQVIHQQEFTLWWVNLFRQENVKWADIEKQYEQLVTKERVRRFSLLRPKNYEHQIGQ